MSQTYLCKADLIRDLSNLGIRQGDTILVHASLRSIGHVAGSASTVVESVISTLGPTGTLVVPAFTPDNSDTSLAHRERVAGMNSEEVKEFRLTMPPFDVATTPSTGMGRIAEEIRTTPGAVRSAHPQTSFAAIGALARSLMDGHSVDCHLGESSPLARLYDTNAWILLIGVGYEACTAFHLAEYRYLDQPPTRAYRCVIEVAGKPSWWEYSDVCLDDSDLDDFGEQFDRGGLAKVGLVGNACCRLMPLVQIVDFAAEWLKEHRPVAGVIP